MNIRMIVSTFYVLGLATHLAGYSEPTGVALPSPVPVRTGASKRLAPLTTPKTVISAAKTALMSTAVFAVPSVNMKLLVLAGDSSEISYHAITAFLDEIGVPYTAVAVDTLTPDGSGNRLASFPLIDPLSGRGLYQGMIYTNSTFGICNPTCVGLLSSADWTTLDNYAAQFQVRVVSYYTWPEAKWGLLPADSGASYTSTNPLNVGFTAAAASIFPYLTRVGTIAVGSPGSAIWAYQATTTAAAGETTTPILTAGTNTVGATHTTADGRETLALTMDNDVSLLHSMAFNYGLINWVTKGVFIGSRQIYFNSQIDDILIGDRLYDPTDPTCPAASNCPTAFTSGTDLQVYLNWQLKKQADPKFQSFHTAFAYVGVGTTSEYASVNTTLLPAITALGSNFWWVTHSFDHPNLDCYTTVNGVCVPANSAQSLAEISQNVTVANALGITIDPNSMVTPFNSGLANPAFVSAAAQSGIGYLIDPNPPPGPNIGRVNAYSPSILQVPRLGNNIFDDSSSPNTGVPGSLPDEYNSIYGPGGLHPAFSQNQTYSQVISNESDAELANMLHYVAFPFGLHISNIVTYDGTHSLASDYMDATIAKYEALCNLPVKSLMMKDIGALLASRARYNASGVTGVYTPGVGVVLTTVNAATIPITGACSQASCLTYGGQIQDNVVMAANSTVTLSLNNGGTLLSGLTLNPTTVTGGGSSTGTVTLTGVAPAAGAVVALVSNNASVIVPSSVTILAGGSSATFSILTTAVAASTTATISATYNGGSKTASLTVAPPAIVLSAASLSPATVTGGSSSTGLVTLSGSAPSGGIVVSLASNNASATVPLSVQVPAGSASATFAANTTAVAVSTAVTITASYNGVSKPASLTVTPPAVTLAALSLNPTSVSGGTSSTATVSLTGVAPTGGIVVSLASSAASATVPSSATVPAGTSSVTFAVATTAVTVSTAVTITASYSGVSKPASLTITPPAVTLAALALNPTSVTGGAPSTATVSLTGVAPNGGIVVALASSAASAMVPSSVTVSAGSASVTFAVATTAVTVSTAVTITASYGGVTKPASLTITPPAATLSALSLNPTSVAGGGSSTGTVTLTGPSPTGGLVVSLASNNSAATVPSSVTIPAGSFSATFNVATSASAAATTAAITGSYNGVTKTALLSIAAIPLTLSSLSLSPTTVSGGRSSTGTVTLNEAAPAGGVTVLLASGIPFIAGVPHSVVIPAGSKTASFTVTTIPFFISWQVTIAASLGSISDYATLTVNP